MIVIFFYSVIYAPIHIFTHHYNTENHHKINFEDIYAKSEMILFEYKSCFICEYQIPINDFEIMFLESLVEYSDFTYNEIVVPQQQNINLSEKTSRAPPVII